MSACWKALVCILAVTLGVQVWGQEDSSWMAETEEAELGRGPAAVNPNKKKRNYPGGGDEEDLRVQANLPEAALKTDSRTLQKDVYRALFKQELKDERQDSVEE